MNTKQGLCTGTLSNCCMNGNDLSSSQAVNPCKWSAVTGTCSCAMCKGDGEGSVMCNTCNQSGGGVNCGRCRPDDKPVLYWASVTKSPSNCNTCYNAPCDPQPERCNASTTAQVPTVTTRKSSPLPTPQPTPTGALTGGSDGVILQTTTATVLQTTTSPACQRRDCQTRWGNWTCMVVNNQCFQKRSQIVVVTAECGGSCMKETETEMQTNANCCSVPPPEINTTTTTGTTTTMSTTTTTAVVPESMSTISNVGIDPCNDIISCAPCSQQAQCRWCGNSGRCLPLNKVDQCLSVLQMCSDAPKQIKLFTKDLIDAPRNVSLGNSTVTAALTVVRSPDGRATSFRWFFDPEVALQTLSLRDFDSQREKAFLNVTRKDGGSKVSDIVSAVTELFQFTKIGIQIAQLDAINGAVFSIESLEIAVPAPHEVFDDGFVINDPDEPSDNRLVIGLGVGLPLLALLILIVVIVLMRRKSPKAAPEATSGIYSTPVTTPTSHGYEYASISPQLPQYDNVTDLAQTHYEQVEDPLAK